MVSVILPAYNAEKTIKNTIKSVLNQTYKNFELIIVNDGSTDGTLKKIAVFNDTRIKIIKNKKNLGTQKTLNNGLRKAMGEYIARIDADDEWIDKNKLQKQVNFLKNNEDYVLVGTGAIKENEKNKK